MGSLVTNLNRLSYVLAFGGMYVAGVLSVAHLFGWAVPCGQALGCEEVAAHPSSRIAGIPIAIAGFGLYFVLAMLALMRSRTGTFGKLLLSGRILSAAGALVSIGLTAYSARVIGDTCVWCLASMILMTGIFLTHEGIAWSTAKVSANPRPRLDRFLALGLALTLVSSLSWHYVALRRAAGDLPYDAAALAQTSLDELAPGDSHILGSPDAPLTIVEFADLMCHACRAAHSGSLHFIESSRGKARLVFRHLPQPDLKGHENSLLAALFAEIAAERGLFWEFVSQVYESPTQPSEGRLVAILSGLGIDPPPVEELERMWPRVRADIEMASRLGITSTPTHIALAHGIPPAVGSMHKIRRMKRFSGLID